MQSFNNFKLTEIFDNRNIINDININGVLFNIFYKRIYGDFNFNYQLKSFHDKDIKFHMGTHILRGIIFMSPSFTDFFVWPSSFLHISVIPVLQKLVKKQPLNYLSIYNQQLTFIINNICFLSFTFNKHEYWSELFPLYKLEWLQTHFDITKRLTLDNYDWNEYKMYNSFRNSIF